MAEIKCTRRVSSDRPVFVSIVVLSENLYSTFCGRSFFFVLIAFCLEIVCLGDFQVVTVGFCYVSRKNKERISVYVSVSLQSGRINIRWNNLGDMSQKLRNWDGGTWTSWLYIVYSSVLSESRRIVESWLPSIHPSLLDSNNNITKGKWVEVTRPPAPTSSNSKWETKGERRVPSSLIELLFRRMNDSSGFL